MEPTNNITPLEQLAKSIQTFESLTISVENRNKLYQYNDALMQSVHSILEDQECSKDDKMQYLKTTLEQYSDAMVNLFRSLLDIQEGEQAPPPTPELKEVVTYKSDDENRFDEIIEVEKFNPYHDARGRFSSANGATSFTHRTKDPTKQHWADRAAAREKERTAALEAEKPKAKVIEFKPAKTKKEAVQYAQDQLGFTKVSYGTKLDIDTINHINEQITNVQNKYPEARGAVSEIKTWNKQGAYAAIETSGDGSMKFLIGTPLYGKGMDYVNRSYDNDVASGFHPKGTNAGSIVYHEYGHALAGISAKKKVGVAANGTINDRNNVREFITDRRAKSTEKKGLFDAAKETGSKPSEMMKNISRYAQANPAETFAEAFAEVMTSPNPSKDSMAIVKASGWLR